MSESGATSSQSDPVLYFDLASPYSYLAVMRAEDVLGQAPALQPVLAGAIFNHRGWGSWALTDQRAPNMREIERRAAAYRLPLRWPQGWPPNSLAAQRAATFAQQIGCERPFAEAVYLATYGAGGLLEELETLLSAGEQAGLQRDGLLSALEDPEVKARLRHATDDAIAIGVMGVPTLRVGEDLLFGDDQLELAAARL